MCLQHVHSTKIGICTPHRSGREQEARRTAAVRSLSSCWFLFFARSDVERFFPTTYPTFVRARHKTRRTEGHERLIHTHTHTRIHIFQHLCQDRDRKDKKDSISDLDFRKLMSLAEQRRGHTNVHASNASNASPKSRQSPAAKRVKKVLLMPSPDEHFLSIERERRAEKMATMSIASPTSPCSEAVAWQTSSTAFAVSS